MYWETICGESIKLVTFSPSPPLMGQIGVIEIANLVLLPYISFIIAFTALQCIERV